MATPNNAELPTGVPRAQPVYLVDPTQNGSPYAAGGGSVGSTVNIADPTTPANKLAIDGSGKIGINALPSVAQATAANLNATATIQAVTGTSLAADVSNTELRTSLYAKNAAAGDTALTITSGGSLHTTIDNGNTNGQAIKTGSSPVVLASDQWSATTPNIVEQNVDTWVRNAQSFVATTGVVTSTTTPFMAFSLFNPNASGKTLYLTRIQLYYAIAISSRPTAYIYAETTDPSGAWTTPATVTPANLSLGSGTASVAVTKATIRANNATRTGTLLFIADTVADQTTDLLLPRGGILIPANNGLTVYLNSQNTTIYSINYWWAEY